MNVCEHIWITKPWAYNFLVCDKCGGWTQDKIVILHPPKEGEKMATEGKESKETLQEWIDSILAEASDKLSDWETNFMESVQLHLEKKGGLTERQEEILFKIYTEKTK